MTLLGTTLKEARETYAAAFPELNLGSLRAFADRAGISAAQVSRIEAGLIEQPSLETLNSLAMALDRNPRYLWIIAGRLTGPEARTVLRAACREDSELFREWDDADLAREATTLVSQNNPSEVEMRLLAARIFTTFEVEETVWAGYAGETVGASLDPRGKELLDMFMALPPGRREKVLEYARDQFRATGHIPTARPSEGDRTMQITNSRPFTEAWLREQGFDGFRSVKHLRREHCANVPSVAGVYAVVSPSGTSPEFLEKSLGGHFKGKDPTVPLDRLEARWVEGTDVLYIGKGNVLSRRLREFMRFGAGDAVGHWGGRLVWQLGGSDDLIVAWFPCPLGVSAREQESSFISSFEETFDCLPFANLTR